MSNLEPVVRTDGHIVVGAGLAGAATAWRLAARGRPVTLLERSQPANSDGSSHGSARILRYAYPDPFYAGLVVRARAGWDELEAAAGQQLVRGVGSLDFGAERDPHALADVLAAVGVDHELLPPEAATERWPGIAFDSDVLWHPGAGVLDAESAVRAMVSLAEQNGAQVRTGWPVATITRHPGGVRVTSESGEAVLGRHAVVCAGGWLPSLLPGIRASGIADAMPPLEVKQEQAYHFGYADPAEAERWPTFIHNSHTMSAYSLPGGRDAGFRGQKIAEYNAGPALSSALAATGLVDPANRARVTDYVRRTVPGLVPEPYAETTCLFTNAPGEDFVIDGDELVTIVSPCSGHGAKFAPLIGRLAADQATGAAPAPARFRALSR